MSNGGIWKAKTIRTRSVEIVFSCMWRLQAIQAQGYAKWPESLELSRLAARRWRHLTENADLKSTESMTKNRHADRWMMCFQWGEGTVNYASNQLGDLQNGLNLPQRVAKLRKVRCWLSFWSFCIVILLRTRCIRMITDDYGGLFSGFYTKILSDRALI